MNHRVRRVLHGRVAPRRPGAARLSLIGGLAMAALVLPGAAGAQSASEAQADPVLLAARAPVQELVPSRGRATIQLHAAARDEDILRTLDLELGKSALIQTDYTVKRVSVGNPEVLEVVVLSTRELHFVPNQIGATNVVIWDTKGVPQAAIDVTVGTTHAQIERQLRKLLGNSDIHVDSAGEAVILRGTVPSPVAAERAVAVARAFFPKPENKVVNVLEVGGNQQVMIEVVIAEMSRTLGRNITSNFALAVESGDKTFEFFNFLDNLSSLETTGQGDSVLEFLSRVNFLARFIDPGSFALTTFLELTTDAGLSKVLAQPTLLARSGQTASFLVGGEVPIPVAQGGAFGSITVEFKEFGVGVQFLPTVLGPDRIHLQVSPEVSEPDFTLATTVGGFATPGFVTRRASTAVELGDGQSFAIAGLLRDDVRESVTKYPVLGDIPILGTLFRSSSFQKNETELVLIVTPRLVKPLPAGPHPLPTDSFIEPNAFEFYLLGALESQRGISRAAAPGDTSGALIGPAGHRVPVEVERSSQ